MALVGGSVELTASLARSAETNATVSHFTNIWKSGRAAAMAAANLLLTATDGEGPREGQVADGLLGRLARLSVQLSMVSYRWNRPR